MRCESRNPFISIVHCHTLGKLFLLGADHDAICDYFQLRLMIEEYYYCDSIKLTSIEQVFKEYPLHLAKRFLPNFDIRAPLNIKKGVKAIINVLDLLPQYLCRWFPWSEQLIEFSQRVNLWCRSTSF